AIPLGSRILFVADAYDAMTTDRVYRSKFSHERAISELERCAGTQFDPVVVAALLEELEDTGTARTAAAGSTSSRRRRRL
ncbi:MAG TPA: HD domain-containing phosphohydrolase, partial [Gaiellaceae bacterium]|nr:HD domain-containing phosphohydrolase [Gaiellaceae bacterium]